MTLYQYQDDDIAEALQSVLEVINRADVPADEKEPIRDGFHELWDDIQQYRGDAAYTAHVEAYVTKEHQRRHDPSTDEERREKPLCGCQSPTCPLRRGALPADARVRHGGLLQHKTPEQAVANVIQRHDSPYVLREADEDYWQSMQEPLSDLMDLKVQADQIGWRHDGPMPYEQGT